MVQFSYITTITSDTTIGTGFDTFIVDASSNSITITLPFTENSDLFYFKRIDNNSANTVTITGTSGQLIDGRTSQILPVNFNRTYSSVNSNWYSVEGSSKGTEINLLFYQPQGTQQASKPYALVNNSFFTSLGFFVYKGSNYYGRDPIKLQISYGIDSDTSASSNFTIQLQDITNTNIIATVGPISQTGTTASFFTTEITTFSNVPTSQSVIEVDAKLNSGTTVRLYSLSLIAN